jgi:hypothetical protein
MPKLAAPLHEAEKDVLAYRPFARSTAPSSTFAREFPERRQMRCIERMLTIVFLPTTA